MKSKRNRAILAGLGTLVFGLLIFWLGGYDYNHRGTEVAFGGFIVTFASFGVAVITYISDEL